MNFVSRKQKKMFSSFISPPSYISIVLTCSSKKQKGQSGVGEKNKKYYFFLYHLNIVRNIDSC
jgi:hypothetical protein